MTSTDQITVLGFAGNLRRSSVNKQLLRAAAGLVPDGIVIDTHDIASIPLYNGNEEAAGMPRSVVDFKRAMATAGGLLVVTPEHNFGMSAATKNALDWASRRSGPGNVLVNKPTAAMARTAVGQTLLFPGAIPKSRGDVGISGGTANFDESGALIDEAVRERVRTALVAFAEWVRFLRSASNAST